MRPTGNQILVEFDELIGVVRDGSIIYAATPFSMFTYNLSDSSIEKLIKGVSTSDIGISKLAYSEDQTVVEYIKRCEKYIEREPDESWSPVTRLTSK